jgi:hypothetical protein
MEQYKKEKKYKSLVLDYLTKKKLYNKLKKKFKTRFRDFTYLRTWTYEELCHFHFSIVEASWANTAKYKNKIIKNFVFKYKCNSR